MNVLYRIKENCPGCGACAGICPVKAIKVSSSAVILDDCISCGLCENKCPIKLIEKIPEGVHPEKSAEVKVHRSDTAARNRKKEEKSDG